MFVDNDADGYQGLLQVYNLMLYSAVIGTVAISPIFFLFRDKPPTPPSKSAEAQKHAYWPSLKALLKNWNYIILITSMGLTFGACNILATVIQPLLLPFGFTPADSGNFGALTLVSGLVGSLTWGVYLDKSKKYKCSIVTCAIMSLIGLGGIILSVSYHNFAYTAIPAAVYGFFATAILSLSFEFSAELSFPVAEAASGGLMLVVVQIFTLVGTIGVDVLVEQGTKTSCYYASGVVGILTVIGLVGFIFTKEDLRRKKVEEMKTIEMTKNYEPIPASKEEDELKNEGHQASIVAVEAI